MYFFLHIPRTAGTTLNAILAQNFRPDEIISVYHADDYSHHREHSAEELAGIRLIQGHLLLQSYDPPLMYGQAVKVFTFLRDPVARLVSEYSFQRSWKANHLYSYLNENNVSFRQYVESREKLLVYRGKNFMTRCISGLDTGGKDYPVKALSRAKKNMEKSFGFVGVQERFMDSLVLLAEFMGLQNLLHERRNSLKDAAKAELAQEDLDIAEERNKGDRELYQFGCELFAARVEERGQAFQDKVRSLKFLNAKYQKVAGLIEQKTARTEEGPVVRPKDSPWK